MIENSFLKMTDSSKRCWGPQRRWHSQDTCIPRNFCYSTRLFAIAYSNKARYIQYRLYICIKVSKEGQLLRLSVATTTTEYYEAWACHYPCIYMYISICIRRVSCDRLSGMNFRATSCLLSDLETYPTVPISSFLIRPFYTRPSSQSRTQPRHSSLHLTLPREFFIRQKYFSLFYLIKSITHIPIQEKMRLETEPPLLNHLLTVHKSVQNIVACISSSRSTDWQDKDDDHHHP